MTSYSFWVLGLVQSQVIPLFHFWSPPVIDQRWRDVLRRSWAKVPICVIVRERLVWIEISGLETVLICSSECLLKVSNRLLVPDWVSLHIFLIQRREFWSIPILKIFAASWNDGLKNVILRRIAEISGVCLSFVLRYGGDLTFLFSNDIQEGFSGVGSSNDRTGINR